MKNKQLFRAFALVAVSSFALGQLGGDLGRIIKVGGMALLVQTFGKDMNSGLNKLTGHKDSSKVKTKVVTILSVGIGRGHAVGAAQVMGPPALVDKVVAIAQPEADLFGKEVRIRALVPVSDKNVSKSLHIVDGVGVSGIVDIKL
jgi:hypothetical protein